MMMFLSKYKIIDPKILSDEKIKELYNAKLIKFLDKYEKKFIKRLMKKC